MMTEFKPLYVYTQKPNDPAKFARSKAKNDCLIPYGNWQCVHIFRSLAKEAELDDRGIFIGRIVPKVREYLEEYGYRGIFDLRVTVKGSSGFFSLLAKDDKIVIGD